jgi:hypothetical protein
MMMARIKINLGFKMNEISSVWNSLAAIHTWNRQYLLGVINSRRFQRETSQNLSMFGMN